MGWKKDVFTRDDGVLIGKVFQGNDGRGNGSAWSFWHEGKDCSPGYNASNDGRWFSTRKAAVEAFDAHHAAMGE